MDFTTMECPNCKGECELRIKAKAEYSVCLYCRSEVMIKKSTRSKTPSLKTPNSQTNRRLILWVIGLVVIISLFSVQMLILRGNSIEAISTESNSIQRSGAAVTIGSQEITERELEIIETIANLEDQPLDTFDLGWYVFDEIVQMLMFQHAKELGVEATLDEAQNFRERQLRDFPNDEYPEMEANDAEYWEQVELRRSLNTITIVNLEEHYNGDLDYRAFGNLLVREWASDNPEIADRFVLEEVMAAFPAGDIQDISPTDLDWRTFSEGDASDIYDIVIENKEGFDFYFSEKENLERILIWLSENQESLSDEWSRNSFVIIIYFEDFIRQAYFYVDGSLYSDIISILNEEIEDWYDWDDDDWDDDDWDWDDDDWDDDDWDWDD